MNLTFKTLHLCNLEECVELEQSSYPAKEGASREKIRYRIENAEHLQLGCFSDGELVGMILASSSLSPKLDERSMLYHQDGPTLCVHSVVVREDCRRRGIATRMFKKYLDHVKRTDCVKFEKCCIIVHQELTILYENIGFVIMGKSTVTHGNSSWIDLEFAFL